MMLAEPSRQRHLPEEGVLFASDILFIGGTPIMWAGPAANFIAACDRILDLGAKTIVPGHGPITDLAGLAEIRSYLDYCRRECRDRFDRGMSVADAAADLVLDRWSDWGEPERVVTLVNTCYREFGHDEPSTVADLFGAMAERWDRQRR